MTELCHQKRDLTEDTLRYNYFIVVKPSHLLDHTNTKCEETAYNVL